MNALFHDKPKAIVLYSQDKLLKKSCEDLQNISSVLHDEYSELKRDLREIKANADLSKSAPFKAFV